MLKITDTIKLIFGLKVAFLRRAKKLSYQQLSDRTGLAISYLHNIEKGKKYPKADKIFALAKSLDTDYNYLVSLEADKRLKPIVDLLQSDFLKIFPLELFGINTPKLLGLLSLAPDKVNAFVSTVLKITRNYHLQGEDFYKAALRSYQDLQNNYFEDIELAVRDFRSKHQWEDATTPSTEMLEEVLLLDYGIRVDREYLAQRSVLEEVRSLFVPEQKVLYLNQQFSSAQERLLLAKEIGFQFLNLKERPFETRMIEVDSFDKLLHNFRASYFSVALLMDERAMIQEIEAMSQWKKWDTPAFTALLDRYDVTPEMLLQRLANIFPHHFDIQELFFLRFYTGPEMQKFIMTKEMHLSQLHDPHANQLDEHYCRRWISISLIRQLSAIQSIEGASGPIAGAQISKYWGTPNAYLCLCMAKPSRRDVAYSNSVTIGLLINDKLRRLFPFLEDPDLSVKDVHTTCERCSIPDCGARAAPPIALKRKKDKAKMKIELDKLMGKKEGLG
ncbi:MAG: hypothetical protein DHS20C18_03490 [Saprospiraceae bacterium]|nr:MAG: hypothetical protein DHS20C18_03490 [Saprospiraceae bacterium]